MLQASNELREYFEIEDGSLPDLLTMSFHTGDGLSDAFEYLLSTAKPISAKFNLWSNTLEKEISFIDIENPALLVATSDVEPFSLMFYGVLSRDKVDFPELGVFVYQRNIDLYYYPSAKWSFESLIKLFEILSVLSKLDGFKAIEPHWKGDTKFWSIFTREYETYCSQA